MSTPSVRNHPSVEKPNHGDPIKPCTCSSATVTKYQKRISGPLLDRIDIHIEVPRVEYDKLSSQRLGEPSAAIRARVEAARQHPWANASPILGNASLAGSERIQAQHLAEALQYRPKGMMG